MKKLYPLLLFTLVIGFGATAQQSKSAIDTATELKEVTIRRYLSGQPLLNNPASGASIGADRLAQQPDNSLVSALNTVSGVKMEERSPGSYRLSIRGSLLRSPFGVRDVKVYFDEIPLTDAGGNTYLNAIDMKGISKLDILKGPDGSLYGANSGGVLILKPAGTSGPGDKQHIELGINGGSYGLIHQNASFTDVKTRNQLSINQAYESYGGYRQNSYMQRKYVEVSDRHVFLGGDVLMPILLYSDLSYETPGGLTQAQMETDPTLARLPTKTVPGALDQHIGIKTKVLLGGLVNRLQFSPHFNNTTSLSFMHVDFANPFITNYEQRNENTYSLRSNFLLYDGDNAFDAPATYKWKLNFGLEWQQTNSAINNYDNNAGIQGSLQKQDKVNTGQHFIFSRYTWFAKRLQVEAALSLNFYGYDFKNLYPLNQDGFTNRGFSPQLMPRLALSYQLTNDLIARASVSRGYSTPTIAEVRPTNNIVNTALQAQTGWNYETGLRLRNRDESLLLDASVFYYRIQNSIVRRLNPDDTEYYVNAGGTKQTGFELSFTDWLIRQKNSGFIRGLQVNTAYTLSSFFFRDYNDATTNYSGNPLTGVPRHIIVSSLQVKLPKSVYVFIQHNYTAGIPLNDANTVFAAQYHLLQAKVGWSAGIGNKTKLEVFAGGDNLLNSHYSLGNDLNAAGNRYFNPSALRNYYAGLNLIF